MTRGILKRLRRFLNAEDGSMVVPFALWTPLFITLMVSSMEMGTVSIRHTSLERALDQTVRDIRLGTGTQFNHNGLKQSICDNANVLPDCMNKLQLEMLTLDLQNFREPDYLPDCVDVQADVTPQRNFQLGAGNQLMFLRACYKYDPFSPAGMIGGAMMVDGAGYVALIASTAFVQEPE